MPTYEFVCRNCEKEFSKTMSITEYEKKNVHCPECDSKKVEQLVSAFMAITSKKS